MPLFTDRAEAGRALAEALAPWSAERPVVLALPRGGLPVAAEVARALNALLDILVVRKLGAPGQPELAIGAVVDGDDPVVVGDTAGLTGLGPGMPAFESAKVEALREVERRRRAYLGQHKRVPLSGRVVILVDDGVATGATTEAAIRGVWRHHPRQVVLGVPVAPREAMRRLQPLVDRLVCLHMPVPFQAVSLHYDRFPQLSDADVRRFLDEARAAAQTRGDSQPE
ncbi:hypothetical protein CCR85_12355 [Rhodothalassium salexigens]|uniref:phosphoribosyltransferase n=1 Tax=Rhodothalassium salexigens TaxID=1086 RepID=UPI0019115CF8|nr:phosphoribosyltransferase family protein [Rhodothalassium salexigens]MBK5912282.1 hypothetical protein [Rhodothalassium salexigens]